MLTYTYECECCGHSFETRQSIKDKALKKCPECGKMKLFRVIGTPLAFITQDPKTVGQLMDRNTKKMGRYEFESRSREMHIKRYQKQEALRALQEGRELPEPVEPTDTSLARLSPEEKGEYIEKGIKRSNRRRKKDEG